MVTKIFLSIGALVAIAFIALAINKVRADQEVDRIWRSLEAVPAEHSFTEDMIVELPAPVKRYFLHAIAPGTPVASSVSLEMSGSFRMTQDKPWIPMQAKEIISALKGLVWKPVIGSGLSQFVGTDYYANKSGRMRFFLWGVIPLVNAHSPDINRSSIGRFVGELIWLPSALLPEYGVSWQAIDEKTIQASLKIDGEPVTLTLVIDTNGKLLKLSLPRWGEHTEDGSFAYIPFGGEVQKEHTFGGFTIPSQMSVGWWFGTDRYSEFFRATIEQAEFR
ncbi:MAG: hypothetical protein ICV54_29360 [Nostoc sp. C3-bin3]|nr:hypothetical protein [Nostoc sp. C3-bin3]